MNKITRVIAGGLTSIMAVGIFALPAAAVEPVSVEDSMCEALSAPMAALNGALDDVLALILAQGSAVTDARADLNDASDALGATGLTYVQALDGVGNVDGTLAAFVDSAADYTEAVITWADAVEESHQNTVTEATNDSVLRYVEGLCGAVPAI